MESESHHDPAPALTPLTDGYRVLRAVGPPHAPLPGVLARTADGETVLLARAEEVAEWPTAVAEEGGHVLAPRDVVRCRDGVAVELDVCAERLDRLLDRRAVDGLRGGEAVTLGVALRRGLAELAAARPRGETAWPPGEWWLTEDARPMFVHSGRGRPADAATSELLTRIAGATAEPLVRTAVEYAATESPGDTAVEDALFAAAEGAPVATRIFPPAAARAIPITGAAEPGPLVPDDRGWIARLVQPHLDREVHGLVSDALHAVRRRVRTRRPKPWLLAGGAAALVLAVGVLWPAEAGESSPAPHEPRPESSATAVPSPSPTPAATVPAQPPEPAALVEVTQALLDAREGCAGEDACLAEVMEDPAAQWPDAPADAGSPTITLLDTFGDVAVLRVDYDEAAVRLVVIAESDGRWVLRAAHEAAQG